MTSLISGGSASASSSAPAPGRPSIGDILTVLRPLTKDPGSLADVAKKVLTDESLARFQQFADFALGQIGENTQKQSVSVDCKSGDALEIREHAFNVVECISSSSRGRPFTNIYRVESKEHGKCLAVLPKDAHPHGSVALAVASSSLKALWPSLRESRHPSIWFDQAKIDRSEQQGIPVMLMLAVTEFHFEKAVEKMPVGANPSDGPEPAFALHVGSSAAAVLAVCEALQARSQRPTLMWPDDSSRCIAWVDGCPLGSDPQPQDPKQSDHHFKSRSVESTLKSVRAFFDFCVSRGPLPHGLKNLAKDAMRNKHSHLHGTYTFPDVADDLGSAAEKNLAKAVQRVGGDAKVLDQRLQNLQALTAVEFMLARLQVDGLLEAIQCAAIVALHTKALDAFAALISPLLEPGVTSERFDCLELQWADPKLKDNSDFVETAVKQNRHDFKFASGELKSDEAFVKRLLMLPGQDREVIATVVVRHYPRALLWDCLREFQDSEKVVLAAVRCDFRMFRHASDRLRDDKAVVLQASRHCIGALEYASERLRNTKAEVLEAIRQDGHMPDFRAFAYASELLRDNEDVVLEAIKRDFRAFVFASERLRNSTDFVLKAAAVDFRAFSKATARVRNDSRVLRELLELPSVAGDLDARVWMAFGIDDCYLSFVRKDIEGISSTPPAHERDGVIVDAPDLYDESYICCVPNGDGKMTPRPAEDFHGWKDLFKQYKFAALASRRTLRQIEEAAQQLKCLQRDEQWDDPKRGRLVSPLLHCLPHLKDMNGVDVDFLDPIAIAIPLPHASTSIGCGFVVKEEDTDVWTEVEDNVFLSKDAAFVYMPNFCFIGYRENFTPETWTRTFLVDILVSPSKDPSDNNFAVNVVLEENGCLSCRLHSASVRQILFDDGWRLVSPGPKFISLSPGCTIDFALEQSGKKLATVSIDLDGNVPPIEFHVPLVKGERASDTAPVGVPGKATVRHNFNGKDGKPQETSCLFTLKHPDDCSGTQKRAHERSSAIFYGEAPMFLPDPGSTPQHGGEEVEGQKLTPKDGSSSEPGGWEAECNGLPERVQRIFHPATVQQLGSFDELPASKSSPSRMRNADLLLISGRTTWRKNHRAQAVLDPSSSDPVAQVLQQLMWHNGDPTVQAESFAAMYKDLVRLVELLTEEQLRRRKFFILAFSLSAQLGAKLVNQPQELGAEVACISWVYHEAQETRTKFIEFLCREVRDDELKEEEAKRDQESYDRAPAEILFGDAFKKFTMELLLDEDRAFKRSQDLHASEDERQFAWREFCRLKRDRRVRSPVLQLDFAGLVFYKYDDHPNRENLEPVAHLQAEVTHLQTDSQKVILRITHDVAEFVKALRNSSFQFVASLNHSAEMDDDWIDPWPAKVSSLPDGETMVPSDDHKDAMTLETDWPHGIEVGDLVKFPGANGEFPVKATPAPKKFVIWAQCTKGKPESQAQKGGPRSFAVKLRLLEAIAAAAERAAGFKFALLAGGQTFSYAQQLKDHGVSSCTFDGRMGLEDGQHLLHQFITNLTKDHRLQNEDFNSACKAAKASVFPAAGPTQDPRLSWET